MKMGTDREAVALSGAAATMLKQWLELSEVERRTFVALSGELMRSSELVETSTIDLSQRFQKLAVLACGQAGQVDRIVALANTIEIDGETVPLETAMHQVGQVLVKVIGAMLSVSQHATRMVYALDKIASDVERSDQAIKQIEAIDAKTRYLALHAATEASHASDAGGASGVIARELQDLSREIATVSATMNGRISTIRCGVREGHAVMKEIATLDLCEHITARQQIDKLLVGIMAQNNLLKASLADSAQCSGDLTKTIGQLITGMQFQDRTKQHLGQVIDVLGVLESNTRALQEATERTMPCLVGGSGVGHDWVERIVGKQTLGAVKHRMLTQLLSGREAGIDLATQAFEVELF